MANSRTGRGFSCILALLCAVLYSSVGVRASVPARNADYAMFDFQFKRVGDTKLDNEVTDCALVKHQFQRGYIRLREYLERIQGCGRQGKMKNIEGIAKSTVEDLKQEAMAEIAKAAREGLHFDPKPTPPPKPATTAATAAPAKSAPAVAPHSPAATGSFKVQTAVEQTGTQRSYAARPVTTPYQQGQVQRLRMPYKKMSVAPLPATSAKTNPFQGLNQLVQAVRNFNSENALQRLASSFQGRPITTQQPVVNFQGGPATAQQPMSNSQGGPVTAQQPMSNFQGGPVTVQKPASNFQGGPVTAQQPMLNLPGGPAAKLLTQSPVTNAQASYKSHVHTEDPGISVGHPLYRPNPPAAPNREAQRPKLPLNKMTGALKKQSSNPMGKSENVDDADENGVTDEALDDSRAVNNPDKDIDDESKVDETMDKEPSDMPMPGVDDETADEGTQSVDVDDSRAGMGKAKQKTAGMKMSASVQNLAKQQNHVTDPRGPFGLPAHAQFRPDAGLNVQAYRNARIQPALVAARARAAVAARARAQINPMGRVGGAASVPMNQNVMTGPARVLTNPSAALRNVAAVNRAGLSNAATQTRPHAIDLNALKNKIMHTTNATYLRHMLQLIRQITHHRDFQKLQGPARAFVNRANTAVQALSKAYGQRVTTPVSRQPYQQPQRHAEVVKKFLIARNPYYAAQSYYHAPYRPPYYALQRMQYGWYNGNTP